MGSLKNRKTQFWQHASTKINACEWLLLGLCSRIQILGEYCHNSRLLQYFFISLFALYSYWAFVVRNSLFYVWFKIMSYLFVNTFWQDFSKEFGVFGIFQMRMPFLFMISVINLLLRVNCWVDMLVEFTLVSFITVKLCISLTE